MAKALLGNLSVRDSTEAQWSGENGSELGFSERTLTTRITGNGLAGDPK